nr:A disintegrin and metalloproteinase with thrombospondin motifs 2-like [Leptinotarsa decemlineata]
MCNYVPVLIIVVWNFVITKQVVDLTHAEDIKFVYPRVNVEAVRRKRDIIEEQSVDDGKVKVVEIGDWAVELGPENNLVVADGLQTEWINLGGRGELKAVERCDYHKGAVKGLESLSTAAVTLCGDLMRAYVGIGDVAYFLEPFDEATGEHVLYKSRNIHTILKRSPSVLQPATAQWMFNLTGDTIDIDSGEENIEFEHVFQEETDPFFEAEDSRRETTEGNSSTAGNSVPFYVGGWHREQFADDEDGYFYDTAWSANVVQARKSTGSNLPPRWMEIAVAVDYTLVAFHGNGKVEQYVLSLLNIVSAIYQDPSLGSNMKLVVTKLMIYDNQKQNVIRRGNAKRSLENVNIWNRRLHASLKPGEPRHDVAIWLTRSDIGGPSGYAPVGGTCDPKRSCALNRDEGLTSAFIIAHETAHILGLSHDGDKKNGNNCSDEALDGSVMAPMVSATFNKFSWSECSKREFEKYTSKWTCLQNPPTGPDEIILNATLQASFTMDEQCRMEFGDGYFMCRAFEIIEPCSHLWCGHQNTPLVCKTKKGPPLEGTECGFGKWCVNGYCEEFAIRRVERVPIVLNPQDGSWGEWTPWGACSRTCGTGVQFRSRECNDPPPSYGGKPCEGKPEEWRICRKTDCQEPLVDMRAQQCKQLPKLFDLDGKQEMNFTWLPYESDENAKKCKFICVNAERKELYISDENLIDGTPCSYENQDNICVQGACQIVGCDAILHSTLRRDRCGICGGNNSDCLEMKVSFDRKLRRESSRVAILPKMSREIKVEINVTMYHSDNPVLALILKNRKKKKYTVTIPNTVVHTKILEGTKFSYKKFNNKHTIWAKGPLFNEMVILAIVPKKEIRAGINISYSTEYSIHKDHVVPSRRFVWILGGWGPCSTSCGGGRRQRTSACWDEKLGKIVKRSYCSLMQKPKQETQKCNAFGCTFEWISGEWEPCSTTCGTLGMQHREIYCVPKSIVTTVLLQFNGTVTNPWRYMVNPNRCSRSKPSTVRPCNRKPCFSYWTFGEWSQCSASCGNGIQTRSSHCPPPEDETFFTCGPTPPPQKRSCFGNYTRSSNQLCRGRRRKKCHKDESEYCAFDLLHRFCKVGGFRRVCCKSCNSIVVSENDSVSNSFAL